MGLNFINLPSIFKDKCVIFSIFTYFKDKDKDALFNVTYLKQIP